MVGAILGDMIGAPYEFGIRAPRKDFVLWKPQSRPTDDTVLTVAVADALLDSLGGSDEEISSALVSSMRTWGRRYPNAGYGDMFFEWLWSEDPQPYGSFGNGSAMRVSPVAWICESLEDVRHVACLTASVTHDHPEGIRGAEAVAAATFLARTGASKEDIGAYVTDEFGYDLTQTLRQLRVSVRGDATCQRTVPAALTCFLLADGFEDAVRTAVSLGGDTDTLGAMAGSVADAFWGVPDRLVVELVRRLPKDMFKVVERFGQRVTNRKATELFEASMDGCARLEEAIKEYRASQNRRNLEAVYEVLRQMVRKDDRFILPVYPSEREPLGCAPRMLTDDYDGSIWQPAFTSLEEMLLGDEVTPLLSFFVAETLRLCLQGRRSGLILNPFGSKLVLDRAQIVEILSKV